MDAQSFSTQPVIELRDAGNQAVAQSGVEITASILSGSGTLVGTTTATTAANGRATFSNLGIDATSPPSDFTLRFSASGLTSVDSVSFTVISSTTPTVYFTEQFNAGYETNYYDFITPFPTTSAQGNPSGSGTNAMQWTWSTGQTIPGNLQRMRRDLGTTTDTLFLSYYIKRSSNWVGSGQAYHPHLIHVYSDLDDAYAALADTVFSLYVEENYNNGTPFGQVLFQDNKSIRVDSIGAVPATNPEDRACAGANGQQGYADGWDVYNNGGTTTTGWSNYRQLRKTNLFTAGNTDWQLIEVYVQLNTVTNGVANVDGVVRFYVNGVLQWERTNVLMRSGARATMGFRRIAMAPYIGDGSPTTQSLYIASVRVANYEAFQTPVASASIPELPSGYTLFLEHPGTPVEPNGWDSAIRAGNANSLTVQSDATAPFSPSSVLRITYPAGMPGGEEPALVYTSQVSNLPRLFYTYWIKYSSNFVGHSSGVNKNTFLFPESPVPNWFYSAARFTGNASTMYFDILTQNIQPLDVWLTDLTGGVKLTVTKAAWNRVSILAVPGSGNGIVRMWVNGTQVINVTNATFPDVLGTFQVAPTWGGIGQTVPADQWFDLDAVRLYTS